MEGKDPKQQVTTPITSGSDNKTTSSTGTSDNKASSSASGGAAAAAACGNECSLSFCTGPLGKEGNKVDSSNQPTTSIE
jgi:hypothetical protein